MPPRSPRRALTLCAASAGAALALAALAPAPAHACGGFFCQVVAVDQNAERVLFEVNGDGTVTAVVEISYTGSPDAFSWVIPISDTPSAMSVVSGSALRTMDAASAPTIIPPEQHGFPPDAMFAGASDFAVSEDAGVYVEDLPQVGDYDPEVISSDDAGALVEWLNDNDYLITEEMEPYVDAYVSMGMKFLGVKLVPGAEVADIAPLSMTYPGTEPMLPLVLTSVSAEPEMSFIIFIAAEQRYGSANYANLEVDEELLQADPRTGDTNYYPLLSWQADQAGGRAFFTEYADSASDLDARSQNIWIGDDQEDAWTWISETLGRHAYVTRLYTRMSNWEMTEDPIFQPVEGGDVSNLHDLSGRDTVHYDTEVRPPVPCGTTYCGPGGVCATTELGDGCVCENGYLSRGIRAPRIGGAGPQDTIACQDGTFDLMASILAEPSDLQPQDPCMGYTCGEGGSCVNMNGMPTCECGDGYAAVNSGGTVTCAEVIETYDTDQLLWPDWPVSGACAGCASTGSADPRHAGGVALAWAAAMALGSLRRSRRGASA